MQSARLVAAVAELGSLVATSLAMKYWLVTFLVSAGWAGGVLGIMYLHTHAQNDALDEKYGQLAGVGFVVVWAFAIFRRWKKTAAGDR